MTRHNHARPAEPGDEFGCFRVLRMVQADAHYGFRVAVQCTACDRQEIRVLAQLRYKPPVTHRGCIVEPRRGPPPTFRRQPAPKEDRTVKTPNISLSPIGAKGSRARISPPKATSVPPHFAKDTGVPRQPWMSDRSLLPKKPPTKTGRP